MTYMAVSMITAFLLPKTATMPFYCTSFAHSKAKERVRSFCRMGCCSVVMQKPKSAPTSSAGAISRALSAYLPTCFTALAFPACIIVLDKENAENRKGIFMIDASKGFEKDGNKNRLREQDIHKIVDVFNKQLEIEKYSRMVSVAEIETNEFNLNIPRYIDSQEAEDIQDIEAHLLGDIPNADIDALHPYWEVYPSLRKTLFTAGSRANYSKLLITHDAVKPTIFSHPEFTAYSQNVQCVFAQWKSRNMPKLKGITVDDKPKKLIREISEDLLQTFKNLKLIDKYDVYQHLMVYWAETMQDDVYSLVSDGWLAGREIERAKKEWEGRLIPKKLIIARYFAAEQEAIENLEADRDLEKKVLDRYKALGVDEIKTLVVEDKWLARLEQDIQTEMQRISQRLTGRIKELAERYETPLPQLSNEVNDLTAKVDGHLKKMGFIA